MQERQYAWLVSLPEADPGAYSAVRRQRCRLQPGDKLPLYGGAIGFEMSRFNDLFEVVQPGVVSILAIMGNLGCGNADLFGDVRENRVGRYLSRFPGATGIA